MFASIAGMIVMGLISIVILIGIISSLSSTEESTKVKDNSVLHLTLSDPIPDRTPENPFHNFSFSNMEPDFSLGLDR
ncbi:MAG: signal peptide peptidase SppA, partial [Bacteroidetes bacterium HGW-Bacteroidetes-12]